MATKHLLRYLKENNLDPKVRYIVQKGKLVPAKKSESTQLATKLEEVVVSSLDVVEEVVESKIEEVVVTEAEQLFVENNVTVNEQITDAVTQTISEVATVVEETKTTTAPAESTVQSAKKKKVTKK